MKAAIYCRLSEEDKNKHDEADESKSIQNQKTMLEQYAASHAWEIYDVYCDDDYAGADRSRPAFNRLLTDAQEGKFDIVLCKTQSRFTRELEMVERYLHDLFPRWGVRFIGIVDNADTANKGNKKSRQINGLVNEWYLEDMSDNIRSVLTNRRENGYHIGSFALYGYWKDREHKGCLVIDEEAAKTVREVFTMYANGMGKTNIARVLNNRGIPNPTEYKRLHGLRYQQPKRQQSTLWKYFAISDMLTNETYIGNLVQGRYGSISYKTKENKPRPKEEWIRVEHTHQPIIDQALWDRVQRMNRQRAKPFNTGSIGIFAKKVCCINCKYVMRSSKSHGKHYLKCETNYISKDACSGAFISVLELEKIVLSELHHIIDQYLNMEMLESGVELFDGLDQQISKKSAELYIYKRKIDEYSHALGMIYLDKAKGIIDDALFSDVLTAMHSEKEQMGAIADDTEMEIGHLKTKRELRLDKRNIISEYLSIKKLDRPMIEKLIDVIYVGKRDDESGRVPVEIHWNF